MRSIDQLRGDIAELTAFIEEGTDGSTTRNIADILSAIVDRLEELEARFPNP